jgi:hypothetical protein
VAVVGEQCLAASGASEPLHPLDVTESCDPLAAGHVIEPGVNSQVSVTDEDHTANWLRSRLIAAGG